MRALAVAGCLAMSGLIIGVATAASYSSQRPDPADSRATAPVAGYDSVFSDYRPYRDQEIRPWKEVNQEVADNPGMGPMGSMKGMSGKVAAGAHDMGPTKDMRPKTRGPMDKPPALTANQKSIAGHDTSLMKAMPEKAMGGKDKQVTPAKSKDSTARHATSPMEGMQGTPGKPSPAMAHSESKSRQPAKAQTIGGTGIIQDIDRANGKVKLTHDAIAALGWPRMTLFFRLKDRSLADEVKQGDKVEFTLEKLTAGYVISAIRKAAAHADMKHTH